MKARVFRSCVGVVIVLSGLVLPGSAQSIYDGYDGFTVSTTPVLPGAEVHPTLWFTADGVAAIKSKKDISAYGSTIWNTITSNVNTYKTRTASSQTTSHRPRMAKYCAFGWIMNGDTTARDKAIEALLVAFDNVPRTASSVNFGDTYDEIYRATWLQNYCVAYDWVRDQLTDDQDSTIRAKLLWETALLRNHMVDSVRYAPRPHNHRSKPAYAVGTAALTFSADNRAAGWLQFALTQQNTVTKYMFSSDGLNREGSHYNVYSLVNALPFMWHYWNVSGVDLFPAYQPMFEYPVKVRSSKGWMPNIEDGYVKPYPTHMGAAMYLSAQTDLHPTEPLAGILQWNWFNTSFPTTSYTGATNDVTWDIDEFITFDPSIPQVMPEFPPTIQMHNGQVVFRGNSSFAQPVERYLLFHGVAESDNHQHPDLLSYVLEYQGTILATDGGYGASGFSDPLRSWYISNESHNVVTVNGTGPQDWSPNVRPTDLHFVRSSVADFAEKKAKTVAGEVRRGILFPGREYWIVYDIGTGLSSATYRLNVHGRGTLDTLGNRLTWTVGADTYGPAARLHSFVLGSKSPVFVIKSGYTSLFKDQVAQSWVEAAQSGDSVMFMHALVPGSSTSLFPSVTDRSTQNALAFSVDGVTDTSQFVLQKRAGDLAMGQLNSDGILVWTHHSGTSLNRWFVNEATHFDWNGRRVLESEHPVTLAADLSVPGFHDLHFEQVAQPTIVTLRHLWTSDTVEAVELNGDPVSFATNSDGGVTFSLTGGGLLRLHADATTNKEGTPEMPSRFGLEANYPNPFNPSTKLRFTITGAAHTGLTVYNTLGQRVRLLFDGEAGPGVYERMWDGRDEQGGVAASGVYIFELRSGSNVQRMKGILLK